MTYRTEWKGNQKLFTRREHTMNEISIGFGKTKKDLINEKDASWYTTTIAQRGYLLCEDYREDYDVFNGSAEAVEYLLKLCKAFPDIEDDKKTDTFRKAIALLSGIMDAVRIELIEPSSYFEGNADIENETISVNSACLPF